jgi:hypothetical protein
MLCSLTNTQTHTHTHTHTHTQAHSLSLSLARLLALSASAFPSCPFGAHGRRTSRHKAVSCAPALNRSFKSAPTATLSSSGTSWGDSRPNTMLSVDGTNAVTGRSLKRLARTIPAPSPKASKNSLPSPGLKTKSWPVTRCGRGAHHTTAPPLLHPSIHHAATKRNDDKLTHGCTVQTHSGKKTLAHGKHGL